MKAERAFVIAEAGVNHNGNKDFAIKLIEAAVKAKADAVKFQTFNAEKLVTLNARIADYQKKASNHQQETQYQMLKKLELKQNDFVELKSYCDSKNIEFMTTPFDIESLYLTVDLLKRVKIASGEITNYPLLKEIAVQGKPIILSTGMCNVQEIHDAFNVLLKNGASEEQITLLHCNTEYPTPFNDVNLKAMQALKNEFNVDVGYSDHTKGIEVPIAAAALGAKFIEKHFTLDRNMKGPDHAASLEPDELKKMVNSIRNVEIALGAQEKKVSRSEEKNKTIARKSIVASKDIKKGEMLTEKNLTTKRPANGISPMEWDSIVGTIANRNYSRDEMIDRK